MTIAVVQNSGLLLTRTLKRIIIFYIIYIGKNPISGISAKKIKKTAV
jgi:hypothetical protein